MTEAQACMPRVAIVIRRIGPYHRARLQALAARVPTLALETCCVDETYAWETVADGAFSRATLFATEAEARNLSQLSVALAKALAGFAPDVVAVPGWADSAGLMALDWARRNGVPAILMSDSREIDAPRRAFTEATKRAIVGMAGAGFAAGRAHADYLVALGMPREVIALGYDVVDNAYFSVGAKAARSNPDAARRRLSLPPRYLLALSRFVEKKNLDALLAAHSAWFARTADPVPLLLVGDGPLRDRLAAALGPGALMRPFAPYETLPALYGLAEGFLLASTVEQWGLTVNEAMASGCPVIASERAGATVELVEDGITGINAEPTVTGLERALDRLVKTDRAALAAAACERIASWGPERFAEGLLAAARFVRPRRRGSIARTLEGPALNWLARRTSA
ncbi:MAG: glycosyltransferase [Parvularcula sp.]|jgi:glycosyltransferase involved in cell wall biosynthesis|nr:glycosyltransferase [Parvularcula sp.]